MVQDSLSHLMTFESQCSALQFIIIAGQYISMTVQYTTLHYINMTGKIKFKYLGHIIFYTYGTKHNGAK